jgi:hypothetical protein
MRADHEDSRAQEAAMAKERISLLLDGAAIARARRYAERHQTSISSLVGDLLSRLPDEAGEEPTDLTPTMRRLLGVAEGGPDRSAYREHLRKKHSR